jgi:hypothetical protein
VKKIISVTVLLLVVGVFVGCHPISYNLHADTTMPCRFVESGDFIKTDCQYAKHYNKVEITKPESYKLESKGETASMLAALDYRNRADLSAEIESWIKDWRVSADELEGAFDNAINRTKHRRGNARHKIIIKLMNQYNDKFFKITLRKNMELVDLRERNVEDWKKTSEKIIKLNYKFARRLDRL